jgi:carboxyl-terminal processing protease
MKKNTNYLPIYLFATLALGVVLGTVLNFPTANFSSAKNPTNKLNQLINLIDTEYVDIVNTDSIVDLAVNDILKQLDPHSVYIAREELESVTQSMKGDFVGIGINFYMHKDTLSVINVVENGPSEKAGLQSGDKILFADKTKLFGRKLPTDSLFSKLKGDIGSEVELTIFRKMFNKKLKLIVTRDIVPIKSVDIALMLDKKVGYIKINRFSETTYTEFHKELLLLKKQNAQTIVIDLRNNGGGYLEKAVEIADEFLSQDQLIVFTKNRKGRVDKTFATNIGAFEKGKVVVLINENSASASEILAGAIQDNDRGIIMGRRSFGKGLVQREMNFGDGSAVRLTIARYYTPTGRSIQKSYDKGTEAYNSDFENRFENGELYSKDSIKIADTIKFKTPKGKIVYGGGGIVPDVFIPLQVEHGDEGITYFMQSLYVGNFVFEQLDKNREKYNGVSFEEFVDKNLYSEDNFKAFIKHFSQNEFKDLGLIENFIKNKKLIQRYITAEFAQQLFGTKYYFEVILPYDAMIKEVIKENKK